MMIAKKQESYPGEERIIKKRIAKNLRRIAAGKPGPWLARNHRLLCRLSTINAVHTLGL